MPATSTHPPATRALLAMLLLLSCAGIGWALAGERKIALLAVGLLAGGAIVMVVAELGLTALWLWAPLSVVAFPLQRFLPGAPLVAFDRVWVGAMVVLLLVLPATARMSQPTRRFAWALALLGLVWELRAVFTSADQLYAIRTSLDALVLPLILFLVVRRAVAMRPALTDRAAVTLVIAGGLLGLVGVAQTLLGFELATLAGSKVRYESATVIRISGPYDVPETYGLSLVICLAATMYWVQLRGRRVYPVGAMLVAIELAAIGLTYFRIAWLSAVIVLAAAVAFRPRRYGRAVLALVGVGLVLAIGITQIDRITSLSGRGSDTENLYTRLGAYKQSVQVWKEHPVFGAGVGQYHVVIQQLPPIQVNGHNAAPAPHSSFFGTLAETGTIGAIALLFCAFAMWRLVRALNRRRASRRDVLLGAAVSGAVVGYALFSLTLTMLPYAPSNMFLAVLLGMAAGRVDRIDADRRAAPRDTPAPVSVPELPSPGSRAHAGVA